MRPAAETPRLACAVLPSWPLQLLARANPSWRRAPMVVLSSEHANAELLHVDARARALGLQVGMRHAAARSLSPELRAGVVSEAWVEETAALLVQRLLRLSPRVSHESAGVFHLDPNGLRALHPSLEPWAEAVRDAFAEEGFGATVVVGFGRFRTRALAKVGEVGSVRVLDDPEAEYEATRGLPLSAFDAPLELLRALEKLDIRRVDQLSRLPPLELAMRFGPEALELFQRTNESLASAFTAFREPERYVEVLELDPPDHDVERLLFGLKACLDRLARRMRAAGLAMARVVVELELDHAAPRAESLEPAAPTLDVKLLVELLRLRLGAAPFDAPVALVRLRAEGVALDAKQLALFEVKPTRDVEAASRAIARLRAAFGPACATRAVVRDANLLEARFAYEPTSAIALPRLERSVATPSMIRRLLAVPRPLAGERALDRFDVAAMRGPYRTEGGWWVRTVRRDYYYLETTGGELLVVYRDDRRGRWFLHGEVD